MDPMTPEEMKIDSRLAGGRCIGQIRCSRKEQAKKSLPQQQEWLRLFAEINKIGYVTDMKEAVSASQTRRRPDLDRIFERKRLVNDFDTVIVQDLSRLTRGGVSHGLELFFKFKALGIRLVSILDGLIDGDEKIIEAARRFQEARAQAKAIALNSRRGVLAARKRGKIAYTINAPFGVDRLIVTEARQPLFRLRTMGDGSQQKWSADGKTLLHTYPPNGAGEQNHHVKQADEFDSFAPGDSNHVEIVNRMFRLKFSETSTPWRIARTLNDEGTRTLRGNRWTVEAVKNILLNPLYLNRAIGDRIATGEFYMNGPSYPVPVARPDGALATYRAEKDWHHEKHEAMESFLDLDEATKDRIFAWQLSEMRRLAERHPQKRGGNRHHNSPYILSGILREKTQKWSLTGVLKGSCRCYRAGRAEKCPISGHWLNRTFSAKALEAPVRPAVKKVLDSYSGIVTAAEAAGRAYAAGRKHLQQELPSLVAQRDELLAQAEFWVKRLRELGEHHVTEKTDPLRNEIVALNRRIQSLKVEKDTQKALFNPDSSELRDSLKQVATAWDNLSNDATHAILEILVAKMEIDYETLEVELELRLPSWAATEPSVFLGCLEKDIESRGLFETYSFWAIPLASYRWRYRIERSGGMILLSAA